MSINKTQLADALFSKAKQKVLGLLYSQPSHVYYTNEIIRLTQMGRGAIQRELANLSNAGLISVKNAGNQRQFQANQSCPLFTELRSIIIKTFGLADELLAALKPVIAQIEIAFIYGSIAKEQETVSSDIDIMLIGKDLTYADIFTAFTSAEKKLSRKINPTFYTSKEWHYKYQKKNHFICSITKQAKIFLIGTEDDLKKLGKSGQD